MSAFNPPFAPHPTANAAATPATEVAGGGGGRQGSLARGTETIAYRRTEGCGPGVVFLGGYRSDMSGTKARALEARCRAAGRAYVCFDYRGHGASGGRFEDGTIGGWTDDALAVIDALTEGPQILVGSSMGAWIMLLAARARRRRVAGLVGVAPAADFTEDLLWARLDAATRATLVRDGMIRLPSAYDAAGYPVTHRLIEEGREHLLLRGTIDLDRPVRLIHGMADEEVPWPTSLGIAERLAGADVRVMLIKDGDHRLSRDRDLALLGAVVDALAAELGA